MGSLDITALLSSQVIEELASQALALDRHPGEKKSSVPPLKRVDRSKDTPRKPQSPPPLVPSQRLAARPDSKRAPSQPSQPVSKGSLAENLSPEFGRSLPQDALATSPAQPVQPVEKVAVEAKSPATTPRTRRKKEAQEAEKPGQKKVFSAQEVKHFANRMTSWAKDRDKRRQDESEKARSQETAQQLQISERSRKLAKDVKPVYERLGDIVQKRKDAWAQARAKQEEMEMEGATMRPWISARAQKVERRFEDHQSWKERRDKRIGEEQLAQYQKQLAQCTFKPQINKTSSSMAQKTAAISFRHGRRPGATGEVAGPQKDDDEEHELPSESSPVSIEDCTPWVGLDAPGTGETETSLAAPPLLVDFDLVNRRASDGDLFSMQSLGKAKSPVRRAASSKAVGKAAPPALDSPSAPVLGLDELNFARRASIPVLSAEDLRKITPRTKPAPRSARSTTGRWAKSAQTDEGQAKPPVWRHGGQAPAKVHKTRSVTPRSTLARASTDTHIIPYCKEFEDVFHFTAQLCR
eukprot:Skav211169  [mRNA]  locus=scaffold1363:80173:81744:- [translate_table: standard]